LPENRIELVLPEANQMAEIFELLLQLGLTSESTKTLFRKGTRDQAGLDVWRDNISGVIYIDDFHVGDEIYETGTYREKEIDSSAEEVMDCERRLEAHKERYINRNICDVGCGKGDFLTGAQDSAKSVYGVELQHNYLERLREKGIPCHNQISMFDQVFDTVFMFHSFEHFHQPLAILNDIKAALANDGQLIIEVPQANDFLLSELASDSFTDFTLWSQHLILHTTESLKCILNAAGFSDIQIEGVQRFPLSNHLDWLANSSPGGHKGKLSRIDSPELTVAYENALKEIDATDTLVAFARI
jgi:SAM-dependent methyltransferase